MRLARHEELVERMARVMWAIEWPAYQWPEKQKDSLARDRMIREATAALDALLAAVVEMGVGVCGIDLSGLGGQRWRKPIDGEAPDTLVLRLEENSHDE